MCSAGARGEALDASRAKSPSKRHIGVFVRSVGCEFAVGFVFGVCMGGVGL
jgi:hypothetical protein